MSNTERGKFLFLEPMDISTVSDASTPPIEDLAHDAREAFAAITRSLADAGYDPVTQLTAYLIADDPTFLPDKTDARALARHIGRDKLLEALLTFYMEHRGDEI